MMMMDLFFFYFFWLLMAANVYVAGNTVTRVVSRKIVTPSVVHMDIVDDRISQMPTRQIHSGTGLDKM